MEFIDKLELQYFDNKFDSLEALLKLNLVGNLINNIDDILISNDTVSEELIEILDIYSLKMVYYDLYDEKKIIFVQAQENFSVNEMQKIDGQIKNLFPGNSIVFLFEKINGMKKKKMLENKLSFLVDKKEIHIFL